MASPNASSEQEQALAVFSHAGKEIRFFKSQQWHVANYALLTYAALVAIPTLVAQWEVLASKLCIGLAFVAAGWALWVLRSLAAAHRKERGRMDEARSKLPLVKEIHAKSKRRVQHRWWRKIRPTVSSILQAAVFAGMALAVFINLSRVLG